MPDATEQYCVIVDLLEMALEASTNLKVAYPRSAGFNDVEIQMIKNVRMLFLEKSGRYKQYLEARKEWTKDQLKYSQHLDPVEQKRFELYSQLELAVDEANYGDFEKGYWDIKHYQREIAALQQKHGNTVNRMDQSVEYLIDIIDRKYAAQATQRRNGLLKKATIAGMVIGAGVALYFMVRRNKH